MTYLAKVVLNGRNAMARADMSDAYQMHCTLARAFAPGETTPPGQFLWRLEMDAEASFLLVQSEHSGRWEAIVARNPDWATSVEERSFDPIAAIQPGRRFRFRLRANPSVKREGKRHALYKEEEQSSWLIRQLNQSGASIAQGDLAISSPLRISASQRKADRRIVVFSTLFDGVLTVEDRALFAGAFGRGIGHAKHLGLGLLSLARA